MKNNSRIPKPRKNDKAGQDIDAPLTVTIGGNLAAAVRWVSLTRGQTPESFVRDAVEEIAACMLTSVGDDEAEQFLSEKEASE